MAKLPKGWKPDDYAGGYKKRIGNVVVRVGKNYITNEWEVTPTKGNSSIHDPTLCYKTKGGALRAASSIKWPKYFKETESGYTPSHTGRYKALGKRRKTTRVPLRIGKPTIVKDRHSTNTYQIVKTSKGYYVDEVGRYKSGGAGHLTSPPLKSLSAAKKERRKMVRGQKSFMKSKEYKDIFKKKC